MILLKVAVISAGYFFVKSQQAECKYRHRNNQSEPIRQKRYEKTSRIRFLDSSNRLITYTAFPLSLLTTSITNAIKAGIKRITP